MNEQGFIYAIVSADRIKIGWSAKPYERLLQVRVHCPFPCELIGLAEGSMDDEAATHDRFARHRLHGEWFDASAPAIREWLAGLTAPTPAIDPNAHPLRAWRKKAGLRLADVADLLEVSPGYICHVEKGIRGCSLQFALKLSNLTDGQVPLESLLPVVPQ